MQTSWQWHRRLLHNLATPEKSVLRLNLDETSIVLNHDGQKGVVTSPADNRVVLVNKKSKQRGTLTHVVLVCDDNEIQPLLPQMIIGNEHVLRVRDMNELAPDIPKNVFLVRAKSSWITVPLLIVLFEMLRKSLDAKNVTKHPVLLMDACPVHLHAHVWRAARRQRIYLCFVPASLTWLVQPLDVVIIRKLKAFVRAHYKRTQVQHATACVDLVHVVRILVRAIAKILQGQTWNSAFDDCGYAASGTGVKSQIWSFFAKAGCPNTAVPDEQPSNEQLLNILPKKRKYDLSALLWNVPVQPARQTRAPACMAVCATLGSVQPATGGSALLVTRFGTSSTGSAGSRDVPIAMGTRSRSRQLAQDSATGHASAPTSDSLQPCPSWTLPPPDNPHSLPPKRRLILKPPAPAAPTPRTP